MIWFLSSSSHQLLHQLAINLIQSISSLNVGTNKVILKDDFKKGFDRRKDDMLWIWFGFIRSSLKMVGKGCAGRKRMTGCGFGLAGLLNLFDIFR